MSQYYSHLLIPNRSDFVPLPAQVVDFLGDLEKIRGAPLEPSFELGKLSGKFRTGRNAFTGETITIPSREFVPLENDEAILGGLDGLGDYIFYIKGKGPAKLPPFKLYAPSKDTGPSEFREEYSYEVRLNLCEASVSMSEGSWKGPCDSAACDGIFRNPWNNEVIRVPNAGCARFWIEFGFGKWLLPRIGRTLELLPFSILSLATDTFGVGFAQGGVFL